MNKLLTAKVCGITFATISMYCSAVLWWSFAAITIDQIIAATIGAGFVVCQYLFHASRNYVASVALFSISVIATIGWIESCYDSIKTTELSSDSSYTQKTKTIAELNNTLTLQNLSASNDLANTSANYTGRANKTLALATITSANITQAEIELKTLKNANPSSQKSGAAIANNLADYRWILWFLLAAMVDIIPRICHRIVKTETAIINAAKEVETEGTETTGATLHQSLQKAPQPSCELDATTETLTEIKGESTDPLCHTLQQEIISGKWGETIPMKRIMAKHNARHDRLKPIFEWLIKNNVIKRQGNRFIRTKLQIQTKDQEQSA